MKREGQAQKALGGHRKVSAHACGKLHHLVAQGVGVGQVLGAAHGDDRYSIPVDGIELGSISMLSVLLS